MRLFIVVSEYVVIGIFIATDCLLPQVQTSNFSFEPQKRSQDADTGIAF